MDPARWRRIEELYHAALEQPSGERAAFLVARCAGDEDLRREVDSLLAQGHGDGGILNRPVWEGVSDLPDEPDSNELRPGLQLGPYRVEGALGAGGMGRVYQARDSRLDRAVAIKVSARRFNEAMARASRSKRSLKRLAETLIATARSRRESRAL